MLPRHHVAFLQSCGDAARYIALTMKETTTVTFEITSWEQSNVLESDSGAKITRAAVAKKFSGDLDGTSLAEVLLCGGEGGGAGYLAMERVTGTLKGRSGSFVIQHGGLSTPAGPQPFGDILPGTGTEELTTIRGTARYAHDERGARVTLEYELD